MLQRGRQNEMQLVMGSKVIAKQRNGLYSPGLIINISQHLYCDIDFEDGSYSDNMCPEDIEVLH